MSDAFSDPPRIAVLMATCNGAAHLAEQLESLAAQKLPPGLLVVSDDGSTDATRAILAGFAAAHPALTVRLGEGPRKGSALNFLSLILGLDADAVDLVAISDQDDVWLPAKLGRAAAALAGVAPGRPARCGGTSLVGDENLKVKGRLPLPRLWWLVWWALCVRCPLRCPGPITRPRVTREVEPVERFVPPMRSMQCASRGELRPMP